MFYLHFLVRISKQFYIHSLFDMMNIPLMLPDIAFSRLSLTFLLLFCKILKYTRMCGPVSFICQKSVPRSFQHIFRALQGSLLCLPLVISFTFITPLLLQQKMCGSCRSDCNINITQLRTSYNMSQKHTVKALITKHPE